MIKTVPKPKQFSRAFLKELLPENAHIIEAGSHQGNDTLKLATLFPKGHIYAFEPLPDIFSALTMRVAHNPIISTYNYALSDYQGEAIFYTTEGIMSTTSSLLEPVPHEHKNRLYKEITVSVTSLDHWAEKENVTSIDFMWLDAQGAELSILKGAQKLLSTATALLVEVNQIARYQNSPLQNEIISYLRTHSFELLVEHLHHETWGNALFYHTKKIAPIN